MPSRRRRVLTPEEADDLRYKVADLEARLRHLESSVRTMKSRREAEVNAPTPSAPEPRARRPRCPGCTLEAPKGRRGVECVWCGFRFDALKLRPSVASAR